MVVSRPDCTILNKGDMLNQKTPSGLQEDLTGGACKDRRPSEERYLRVHVPLPSLSLLVEPHLHLLEHLGRVPDGCRYQSPSL